MGKRTLLCASLSLLAGLSAPDARAAALWSVGGATVNAAVSEQLFGTAFGETAPDGNGGAYFVWADNRDFSVCPLCIAEHEDGGGSRAGSPEAYGKIAGYFAGDLGAARP